MLFSIIYLSKATKLMRNEDLVLLLEESRNWNKNHNLTGMLLYIQGKFLQTKNTGRFMQVLEGPEEQVKTLFEKIKKDKRHNCITVLNEGFINSKSFESWLMGFESLDEETYKMKLGFFELDDSFTSIGNPQKFNMPLNFLKSFYLMQVNSDIS